MSHSDSCYTLNLLWLQKKNECFIFEDINLSKNKNISFIFQELNKKKKKSKITLKSERDNDFNDLAASSSGNYGYDDIDDDFI